MPILLFHRVSNDIDKYWEPIKPIYFEKIIKFLSKKYQFIDIEDLFSGDIKDFKNKCIITFDDGYDDFTNHSLPILKKYKIKPIFFLTTETITKNNLIWTSELNYTLNQTQKDFLYFEDEKYILKTEKQKLNASRIILKSLKKMNNSQRVLSLEKIKRDLNYSKPKSVNMMSWDQIKNISKEVNFQSHTSNHPMMSKLTQNEITFELLDSKKNIENHINKNVQYLSYPIGDYNQNVIIETSKHYEAAFAVEDKMVEINNFKKEDYLYKIPRINITDKTVYEIFFRINGFHTFIKNIKNGIR